MKVLAITPIFFPELGGIQQIVLDLALRTRVLGVHMDIAHVAPGLRAGQSQAESVDVYRVPLKGHRALGWAPDLSRLARRYDLLHVHDPQLLAITLNVRIACRGMPAVLSTHGGFWHTSKGYWLKRLHEAMLLRGAAGHYRRVLATSSGDLTYFKRFVERVVLCSNGVHVKRFNAVPSDRRGTPQRWIYWGRLSRNKRIDLVIDYAAHARRLGFEVDLLICGADVDGLLPELKAQTLRLKIEQAVQFEPFQDGEALRQELAQRTVYMTASEHEGFGISIVEAMAAGLIVACRDMAPLNTFYCHRKSGWALKFDGSSEDLASLRELLSLSEERTEAISSNARCAALEYDWDTAAPRFVRHYREVLGGADADADEYHTVESRS